ncbi:hypothetical protein BG006_007917 [Podila minutissima]|uniref:Phospholipid/glycerol acyltransferase domain-containing protein n=1 Tax=Podila minutissima TaxID=64525 RepID=A0A9P5VKE6_9FUNG|nr:hypothetical protein BG006_007917 [Podila minutissima]
MIVKPIAGLVKLALVAVVGAVYLILESIGLVLTEVVTLKRGRAASNKAQSGSRRVSGQIIISNWSSYIDILYLAFRYDPVFTQIYSETLTVRQVSLWQALWLSGSYPELAPAAGVETLSLMEFTKAMHKKGAGPVVVFPEGTTTNNRAILKFVPIFKEWQVPETSIDISILALKYDYRKFAPTFTVGLDNSYHRGHLFRTCAQFVNTLSVKSLNPEESPSNPNFSAMEGLSSTPQAAAAGIVEPVDEDALGSVILNLMGRITRYRKLGLNVKDKAEFLDFFDQRNNGISAKKTQKAPSSAATSSQRPKRH